MGRNAVKRKNDSGSKNFSRFNSFDRGRFHSSPRDMHKAACADCGKECEVSFKPKERMQVYRKEFMLNINLKGFNPEVV